MSIGEDGGRERVGGWGERGGWTRPMGVKALALGDRMEGWVRGGGMGLTGGMHRKGRGLCKWGRVGVIIHSKSSISIITAPLMRQSFAARCCCRRAAASCAPCATPHARSTPALPWRRGPRLLLCTIFWLDIAMISSHKTMSMGSMRRRPLPTPEAALRARGCASP